MRMVAHLVASTAGKAPKVNLHLHKYERCQMISNSNKDYMATNANKVVEESDIGTLVTHRNSNLVFGSKIIIY